MKHIHIDMVGGLAGDMFLAAALDANIITVESLETCLSKVGLGNITVSQETVDRFGIRGNHIQFSGWPASMEKDHRHLTEIEKMIQDSTLAPSVKNTALALFRVLGQAESFIHQMPMEKVHFHEIGAIDSILDFVGAAFVIEQADATWSFNHIPLGRGVIKTDHGTVPALAPATAKLLESMVLEPRDVSAELITPTGAAILAKLSTQSKLPPVGRLVRAGYGAGTKNFSNLANVVRINAYETQFNQDDSGMIEEPIVRLCTEIDDMSPELLAFAAQKLMQAGALDVVQTPIYMKKNRAATQLTVLVQPKHIKKFAALILAETTTLGVRVEQMTRFILPRSLVEVELPWGKVHVKIADRFGTIDAAPEYDDCTALALENNLSIQHVYQAARMAAHTLYEKE